MGYSAGIEKEHFGLFHLPDQLVPVGPHPGGESGRPEVVAGATVVGVDEDAHGLLSLRVSRITGQLFQGKEVYHATAPSSDSTFPSQRLGCRGRSTHSRPEAAPMGPAKLLPFLLLIV